MDGYAVVAESTEGATAYSRLPLTVIGDLDAGPSVRRRVATGQAVRIMTGAPMPRGADAVLPAECVDTDERRTTRPSSARSPPSRRASTSAGAAKTSSAARPLLDAGRVLRPQDLGVLSSIGAGRGDGRAPAARPAGRSPATSCCRRARRRTGFQHRRCQRADAGRAGRARRRPRRLPGPGSRRARRDSRGASRRRGRRHRLRRLERRHRGSGADAGRRSTASWPCTASRCARAAPPASAASATGWCSCCRAIRCRACAPTTSSPAARFARSAAAARRGRTARCAADCTRKISSPIGRLDYARVTIVGRRWSSRWPSAGASLLSSTTRADGFVIVGDDSEGFAAGADVEVWLYA